MHNKVMDILKKNLTAYEFLDFHEELDSDSDNTFFNMVAEEASLQVPGAFDNPKKINKVSVLVKNVGEEVKNIEIENSLRAMQEVVGGYVEKLLLPNNIYLYWNEEGKYNGLEENIIIQSKTVVDIIFGNVFFSSVDKNGELESLSEEQKSWIESHLSCNVLMKF
jgi:hypothetical protein